MECGGRVALAGSLGVSEVGAKAGLDGGSEGREPHAPPSFKIAILSGGGVGLGRCLTAVLREHVEGSFVFSHNVQGNRRVPQMYDT